jgi:hypothetical protein
MGAEQELLRHYRAFACSATVSSSQSPLKVRVAAAQYLLRDSPGR